jgi:hypothetical protein
VLKVKKNKMKAEDISRVKDAKYKWRQVLCSEAFMRLLYR